MINWNGLFELYSLIESMTFEQYRRYLSIKEMMAEMDEKDFSDVIDEEEFTADRTWDYESYDAFAESSPSMVVTPA